MRLAHFQFDTLGVQGGASPGQCSLTNSKSSLCSLVCRTIHAPLFFGKGCTEPDHPFKGKFSDFYTRKRVFCSSSVRQ